MPRRYATPRGGHDVPGATIGDSTYINDLECITEFAAYRGLTVTVKYDVVEESETIPYTAPRDCSGQGGGLPVTGPAAGAVAVGTAVRPRRAPT